MAPRGGTLPKRHEPNPLELEALRRIVVEREVCWDVFPERVGFSRAGIKAIGFELVLIGIHSPGEHPPRPGCPLCKEVYRSLRTVAEWILPDEHRASMYEIGPYHAAIRATHKRNMRPEVSLSIRILHRDHFDAPIDACETRCLAEMEERLARIWASKGAWVSLERRGIGPDIR